MYILIWRGAGILFLVVWVLAWLLTLLTLEWSGWSRSLSGDVQMTIYGFSIGLTGMILASDAAERAFREMGLQPDIEFPGAFFFIPVRVLNWIFLGFGLYCLGHVLIFGA
jgi:hypothetical protein